jgi:hypothetical protein
MSTVYSPDFYRRQADGSRASANMVVPSAVELVKPSSVVDLGCGVGAWLSVFASCGVKTVHGFDGSWVPREALLIPHESFTVADLETPPRTDRRYDLAMSLEVAEHLSSEAAGPFVDTLCRLSDTVLFSAAIPGQGGVNHLNEQYQSYWAGLFVKHGFLWFDVVRAKVWNDPAVAPWYAQNMMLYVLSGSNLCTRLTDAGLAPCATHLMDVVHPRIYAARVRPSKTALLRRLRTRLGRVARSVLGG